MADFFTRFSDYYNDPFFLPRSRARAFFDLFPALLFAIRVK